MSTGNISGQVLGTATFAAGVAALPYTGVNTITAILPIVAIVVGIAVLTTFVVTRIIRARI